MLDAACLRDKRCRQSDGDQLMSYDLHEREVQPAPAWWTTWLAFASRLLLWLISGEFKGWLLSGFLVGFGLWELAKQELSILCWKKTQGIVIESRTEWIEQKGGIPGAPLTVHIRYRYWVAGQPYESTRITTGEPKTFYWVQEAAAFRKQFPPGAPVMVLYAPYDPSQATLFAERSSGPWILLGFGIPILLLTLRLRWQRHRQGEEPTPDLHVPLHIGL